MNKIVAVSMVKNEADVIESCMRHIAQFADEILVCDHMSTDRTLDILKSLRDEGLPIKISSYEKNEINQDVVHDRLLSDAIESGADIIFPIDADEFPIMLGGKNSKDLRKFLQNLDPNRIYDIKWIHCMFLEPEKDQGLFTLARPALRSRDISKNDPLPKLILGVKAWIENKLYFTEGHHHAWLPNKEQFPTTRLNEIEMFHFFCRSRDQWLSKDLTIYVNHILRFSYYNWHGPRSQHNVKNYLAGKTLAANDLEQLKIVEDPIPAEKDLAPYRDEVTLKFSGGGGVDSLRNIFHLACSIAREFNREKLYKLDQLVRVFVFHSGDAKKTIDSIQSVIDQDYPHKKIFIVVLNDSEIDKIIHDAADLLGQITFIPREKFSETLLHDEGRFVQFVVAGDRLLKDKLTHSVEFMNSDYIQDETTIGGIFADVVSATGMFWGITYPKTAFYLPDDDVLRAQGSIVFSTTLRSTATLQAGITRGFFRQTLFTDKKTIEDWISTGNIVARQEILWKSMMNVPVFAFLNETLVDGGAESMSPNEIREFYQILKPLLEEFRGSKILSETQYQSAKKIVG